jgi:hypothetical protein
VAKLCFDYPTCQYDRILGRINMRKINKIVLFVTSPFSERDFKRFGIDILRSNGFEVFVYDFSPLVYPKLYDAGVSDPIEYKNHYIFVNKFDAIKTIRELGTDVVSIFHMFYGRESFWIYKTFSKTNVPYINVLACAIPQSRRKDPYLHSRRENSDTKHFLNDLFKKVSRLSIRKIQKIPYRGCFARYFGIRPANLVVAAGAEALNNYRKIIYIGEKTEILYTPSFDYNIFLEMSCPIIDNKANVVYLDPGLINRRGDNLATGVDYGVNGEKQLSNLRDFFNKVEKETGCNVTIAAHPGYDGCCYPDEFGKRLTIVGKTADMISRSNFVMTHSSTAIAFAIAFGKPIIFLTLNPDEEQVAKKDASIEQMASWCGKAPINIDHLTNVEWEKELKINHDLYLNYKNSFLIAKGTEEINSWQIVSNRMKLM